MDLQTTSASDAVDPSANVDSRSKRASATEGKSRYPAGQQRKWLRVDAAGNLTCVAADKHTLVSTLGIPLRDLRLLDPLVSGLILLEYTSAHRELIRCYVYGSAVVIVQPWICGSHVISGRKFLPDMHLCQRKGSSRQLRTAEADYQQRPMRDPVGTAKHPAASTARRLACLTRSPFREGPCQPSQTGCRKVNHPTIASS